MGLSFYCRRRNLQVTELLPMEIESGLEKIQPEKDAQRIEELLRLPRNPASPDKQSEDWGPGSVSGKASAGCSLPARWQTWVLAAAVAVACLWYFFISRIRHSALGKVSLTSNSGCLGRRLRDEVSVRPARAAWFNMCTHRNQEQNQPTAQVFFFILIIDPSKHLTFLCPAGCYSSKILPKRLKSCCWNCLYMPQSLKNALLE